MPVQNESKEQVNSSTVMNPTSGIICADSIGELITVTIETPTSEKATTPPPIYSSTVQAVDPPRQESNTTPPTVQEGTKPTPTENVPEIEVSKEDDALSMQVTIGNKIFSATLEENAAVDAFIKFMRNASVVINMNDHGGFEKVGSLGTSLPTVNSSITANEGDIVLYNGNQIVAFYGSNSWSYTKLGKIDDLSGWREALGDGNVTMTFSIK